MADAAGDALRAARRLMVHLLAIPGKLTPPCRAAFNDVKVFGDAAGAHILEAGCEIIRKYLATDGNTSLVVDVGAEYKSLLKQRFAGDKKKLLALVSVVMQLNTDKLLTMGAQLAATLRKQKVAQQRAGEIEEEWKAEIAKVNAKYEPLLEEAQAEAETEGANYEAIKNDRAKFDKFFLHTYTYHGVLLDSVVDEKAIKEEHKLRTKDASAAHALKVMQLEQDAARKLEVEQHKHLFAEVKAELLAKAREADFKAREAKFQAELESLQVSLAASLDERKEYTEDKEQAAVQSKVGAARQFLSNITNLIPAIPAFR